MSRDYEEMSEMLGEAGFLPEELLRLQSRIQLPAIKPNEVTISRDDSDIGNARLFSAMFQSKIYHVYPWKWTAWDGKLWQRNADWIAMRAAIVMADRLLDDAIQLMEEAAKVEGEDAKMAQERAKKHYTHACRSRQSQRIKAALELSEPDLHSESDIFDQNPYDLNTPDGIVDLRTGAVRPHNENAMCTMITKVAPRPGDMPMFERFLDVITCGDVDLQDYLRQVAGMALIGKVFVEGIVLCYGVGSNGKSTLLNLLARIMGDYACNISPELLLAQRNGQTVQGLADVRGKRLAVAAEMDEGRRLSTAAVKHLSSTDNIVAKRLYKDPEEFTPTHTLCLCTNFLPKVGSVDKGTWRRLFVVPFQHTIPDSEKIPDFADQLFELEGPQILAWAVEGAKQFIAQGHSLNEPAVVKLATSQYEQAENWIQNFLADVCEMGPGYTEKSGRLYEAYRQWAQNNGEYVRRSRDFAPAMEMAGYVKKKLMDGAVWLGIRISGEAMRPMDSGFSYSATPPF